MKTILSVLLLLAATCQAESVCEPQTLHILTQTGDTHTFQTEVACTMEKRVQGLKFRAYMPPQTGMLFPSDTPRQFVMWMKDTPLPLDMLFIDRQGVIRQISHGEPKSEALIYGPKDSCAVLELKAGEADNLRITVGDRVSEDIFCLDKNE